MQDNSSNDESTAAYSSYWAATYVCTWTGHGHRAMASLFRTLSDPIRTAYHLLRSLCCRMPFAAREGLLAVFERALPDAEELVSVSALSVLSFDKHLLRFHKHLLACLGIAYARAGADRFTGHLEKTRRHLAMLQQMIVLEGTNAPDGRRAGSFHEV